ncbi:MAG: ExbD/TolR family protein [Myxococcota bacterium]
MAISEQRPNELISGINVTPLVDVVLVLLIVLMVTAHQVASRALPMDLPKASTGESSEAPFAISIDRHGNIHFDGRALSKDELRTRLRSVAANSQRSVLIAADGGVEHRAVVAVIDVLRAEGISKLAINVAPEDVKP